MAAQVGLAGGAAGQRDQGLTGKAMTRSRAAELSPDVRPGLRRIARS